MINFRLNILSSRRSQESRVEEDSLEYVSGVNSLCFGRVSGGEVSGGVYWGNFSVGPPEITNNELHL